MRLHRAITALAALVALAACDENAVQDITGPVASAQIRFFNFGINAPAVHFYSGDDKLSASSSTSCQAAKNPPVTATDSTCLATGIESTAGVAYGSVTAGGNYIGIAPGQHTFSGRITATTDKGTQVSSAATTIADGKFYSYYQTGLYNTTTKRADAFIVEDNFPTAFDWSSAYVRFVNASHNAPPMSMILIDIASGQSISVGGAVAFKSAGEFVKIPATGYNLALRVAGSPQDLVVRGNVGFEAGTVYTISLRGDMTVTSATAANRPLLEAWINR